MFGTRQDASVRIFISYSSKDDDLVDRLKAGLTRAGAAVWLDHEKLVPGTPNWQVAVRNGISQATHVIYVASETAAVSTYVFDEINIARNRGKPVIPFWARGRDWHDCVPIGWGATQYADGRGTNFDAGLAGLMKTLGLPETPALLVSLGFRAVNFNGTPAIVPPLITIPSSPFLMGSDESKGLWARDNETPKHRVAVAAFQISKYPVTVAEYALAVTAEAVRDPPSWKPDDLLVHLGFPDSETTWRTQLKQPYHPVVCVSWHDAMAYITWLIRATGQSGWRLPSEAEWEKAARWDSQHNISRIYPWGDRFDESRCNTGYSGIKTTNTIGSYPVSDASRSGASPFGVEEMAGNVWEWTSSLYKPYPYMQNDGREDSESTDDGTLRAGVVRGGSWSDRTPTSVRAAYRLPTRSDVFDSSIGFRLALSSETSSS